MNQYQKIWPMDPEPEALKALFNASGKADWLYFPEEDIYAYRPNLLVSLVPRGDGGYGFCYGDREVFTVPGLAALQYRPG